jgi:hypothetical protein
MTTVVRVKSTGSTGEKGAAHLIVGPNKYAVTFDETQKRFKGLRTEISDAVIGLYDAWKEQHKADVTDDGLPVYATMQPDNEVLMGIRPLNGIFRAVCLGIPGLNDEAPKPVSKEGKFGEYFAFIPLFEITHGAWKGSKIPAWFIYKLAALEDGNTGIPSGKNGDKLADFLTTTGVFEFGDLKFSDNELPEWDKRIKQAKKSVQIILKAGYLDNLVAFDGLEEVPVAQKELVPAENVTTPATPTPAAPKAVDPDDDSDL